MMPLRPPAPSVNVYAFIPAITAATSRWSVLPSPWDDALIVKDWLAATAAQRELYSILARTPDVWVPTMDLINQSAVVYSDTVLSGVYGTSCARWGKYGIRMDADRLVQSNTVSGPRKGPEEYAKYRMRSAIAQRIRLLGDISR